MRRFLVFILILVSTRLYAQERFSLLLDQYGINQLSSGIEIIDGGYIVPSFSTDFSSIDTLNYVKTYALWYRVSPEGSIVHLYSYRKPYHAIEMFDIVRMDNSHFLIGGRITDLVKYKQDSTATDVYIVKINDNGDTLWTRTHSIVSGYDILNETIGTSNGSYIMVGRSGNKIKTDSDFFLLKTDADGNKVFAQTYTFGSNTWDVCLSVCEANDKGFFLLGATDDNVYLVKTDSMGNKQWDKRYGLDGKDWLGSSVIKTKNNEYLIAGGVRTASSTSGDGWVKRIDSLGSIIWQKTYGGAGYDGINTLHELPSGDIIAVGSNASHDNPDNKNEGWIMKLDAMGNLLWERVYGLYHIPNDSLTHSVFYNFKPTVDGGFAIVGSATRKGSPQKQDAWLLKLDSFGCLVQGCQLVGLENVPYSKEAIKLYPNPAKEQVQLSHSRKIRTYRIADYTGKLLQSGVYPEEGISIHELSPGVYIVQVLLEDRSQAFGRLLVE